MKLPKLKGYSNNVKITNHNIINKRLLNNIKIIKYNPFKNMHNNIGNEKKSLSVVNLKKKKLYKEQEIMTINSYLKSNLEKPINKKIIKIVKKDDNNDNDLRLNSDNLYANNDNNNDFNDTIYTENRFKTLINSKSSFINNRNENNKIILPTVTKMLGNFDGKNKLNQSVLNINKIKKIKLKQDKYIRDIIAGVKEEEKFKKLHEYNIRFDNSFLYNINWNNNILKNMLKNKKININMEAIKNYKIKNKKMQFDKEKEKKNILLSKSIDNENDNSYFNSEINNFFNNCKYKNNKLILSLMKKRNNNNNINKRIYLSRFNENIYNNYCESNNLYNENPKFENRRASLFVEKEQEKSRDNSMNNSIFKLNHF